jgi:hypothetical protein
MIKLLYQSQIQIRDGNFLQSLTLFSVTQSEAYKKNFPKSEFGMEKANNRQRKVG